MCIFIVITKLFIYINGPEKSGKRKRIEIDGARVTGNKIYFYLWLFILYRFRFELYFRLVKGLKVREKESKWKESKVLQSC